MSEQQARGLRAKEVQKMVGLSRTSIWRLERQGKFPRRRVVGKRNVIWMEHEVAEWLNNLEAVNNGKL